MKFILLSWVKYYTKEMFKTLRTLAIGAAIILAVVFIKFKPAYEVIVSEETIGYVNNKDVIDSKIEKYVNDESGNVAFREIEELPHYGFKMVTRDINTEDRNTMLAIENLTTTTYKNYAVTSNGETKVIVDSQRKAEDIINETKANLEEGVELDLGIVEVYETANSAVEIENAKGILTEYKVAKETEFEAHKKEEEERLAKEAQEKAMKSMKASQVRSIKTTATSEPTGSLNGMALSVPVNGTISSRFGARSRIRSSAHTGLDIATSLGTGIRPIAPGTVSYAGYKGSYGKLIIIDHGEGIVSYYAHCNELYVTAGQAVDTSSTIGAVGSTGNSTGPHLHLEIRINGKVVNPQNYLY